MNWLLIVFVIVCLGFVFYGAHCGFVRMALSMLSFLIVMAVAGAAQPLVSEYLTAHTAIYDTIQESAKEMIAGYLVDQAEEPAIAQQVQIIDELPLPEAVKDGLLKNNNAEGYAKFMADKFSDYVAAYIASLLMKGLSFLAAFIIAYIIVRVFCIFANFLAEVPGISLINRMAGAIFGGVQALLWIYLFLALATILSDTGFGVRVLAAVNASPYLKTIYDENLLWRLLTLLMYLKIG